MPNAPQQLSAGVETAGPAEALQDAPATQDVNFASELPADAESTEQLLTTEEVTEVAEAVNRQLEVTSIDALRQLDTAVRERDTIIDNVVEKSFDTVEDYGRQALKAITSGWKKLTAVVNPRSMTKFAVKTAVNPVVAGATVGALAYQEGSVRQISEPAVRAAIDFGTGFIQGGQPVAEQIAQAPSIPDTIVQPVAEAVAQQAQPLAEAATQVGQQIVEMGTPVPEQIAQSAANTADTAVSAVSEAVEPALQSAPTQAAQTGEAARVFVDNTLDSAGQWIGQTAESAGRWANQAAVDTGKFIVDNGPDALLVMGATYLSVEASTFVASGVKPLIETFKKSTIAIGETADDAYKALQENGPKEWALELANKAASEFIGDQRRVNRIVRFIDGPMSAIASAVNTGETLGKNIALLEAKTSELAVKAATEVANRFGGNQNRPGGLRYLAKSVAKIVGGDNFVSRALISAESSANSLREFSKQEAATSVRAAERAAAHKVKADKAAVVLAQLQTLTDTSNSTLGFTPSPLHRTLRDTATRLATQRATLAANRRQTWGAVSATRGARATAGNMFRAAGTMLSQTTNNFVTNSITANAVQGRLPNWTKTVGSAVSGGVNYAKASAQQLFSPAL